MNWILYETVLGNLLLVGILYNLIKIRQHLKNK